MIAFGAVDGRAGGRSGVAKRVAAEEADAERDAERPGPDGPARRAPSGTWHQSCQSRWPRSATATTACSGSGTLISQSGDWMDQIALNWLVYQLTGSAFALGLVNLCRLAPILLFTLVGGVIADRVERRKLMFTTQTVAMVLALVLAALVSTGLVEFWMVLLVAVGRGIALSFNLPARQSLISDLVPREILSNAIALNQATINLTRVLGPAIGGILIATIGVAGAFYVNGFSFLAVLYGLALMRFPPREVRAEARACWPTCWAGSATSGASRTSGRW